MSSKTRKVASVTLRTDRPTELHFSDLYSWVIWQFPRLKRSGLCGAVRPPIANHCWFPAFIQHKEDRLVVYGHVNREFQTPEAAADWLESDASG